MAATAVPARFFQPPPTSAQVPHTYTQRAHNTHSPARLPLPLGRHPGLLPFGNSAFGTPHHNTTRQLGVAGAVQWQLLFVGCSVRSCHFPSVRPNKAHGAGGAALLVQWPGVCGKTVEPR